MSNCFNGFVFKSSQLQCSWHDGMAISAPFLTKLKERRELADSTDVPVAVDSQGRIEVNDDAYDAGAVEALVAFLASGKIPEYRNMTTNQKKDLIACADYLQVPSMALEGMTVAFLANLVADGQTQYDFKSIPLKIPASMSIVKLDNVSVKALKFDRVHIQTMEIKDCVLDHCTFEMTSSVSDMVITNCSLQSVTLAPHFRKTKITSSKLWDCSLRALGEVEIKKCSSLKMIEIVGDLTDGHLSTLTMSASRVETEISLPFEKIFFVDVAFFAGVSLGVKSSSKNLYDLRSVTFSDKVHFGACDRADFDKVCFPEVVELHVKTRLWCKHTVFHQKVTFGRCQAMFFDAVTFSADVSLPALEVQLVNTTIRDKLLLKKCATRSASDAFIVKHSQLQQGAKLEECKNVTLEQVVCSQPICIAKCSMTFKSVRLVGSDVFNGVVFNHRLTDVSFRKNSRFDACTFSNGLAQVSSEECIFSECKIDRRPVNRFGVDVSGLLDACSFQKCTFIKSQFMEDASEAELSYYDKHNMHSSFVGSLFDTCQLGRTSLTQACAEQYQIYKAWNLYEATFS